MQYIKIHSLDNVAVALADMAEGSVVTVDGSRSPAPGYRSRTQVCLRAIAKGENVVKYGLPIGHALADIAPGSIFMPTIRAPI
jgi:altronate hydrolase